MRPWLAIAPLLLAAACATTGDTKDHASKEKLEPGEPAFDRAARAATASQDALSQMTFWAHEYEVHPKDLETKQKFVDALRAGGRFDRAAEVALDSLEKFPADHGLMRSYGLALIAAGKAQQALRPLALTASSDAKDWSIRSALGAALDQVNRSEEARRAYQEALTIKPDEPEVLTNLGVSYLMTGDPAQALPILQKASTLPGATSETRVNLAIALALTGKFEEAERIQRVDLPPEMVASNMSYLRGLQSDPRRWGELRAPSKDDKEDATRKRS